MTIYRATFKVRKDRKLTREHDCPYPNDRTAIKAFGDIYGDKLVSIENMEIIGSGSMIFPVEAPDEPETPPEAPDEPETPPEAPDEPETPPEAPKPKPKSRKRKSRSKKSKK